MSEEWRPIVDTDGAFMVSDYGRVKSMPRVVSRFNPRFGVANDMEIRERILRPATLYGKNRDGSRRSTPSATHVSIVQSGRRVSRYVHHLVLEAFVGEKPEGMEACHGDGDATNNKLDNLRWDTHVGNVIDSIQHGTFWPKHRGRMRSSAN